MVELSCWPMVIWVVIYTDWCMWIFWYSDQKWIWIFDLMSIWSMFWKLGWENIKIPQELDFYLFYEVWMLEHGGSYIIILSSVLGPSHEIKIILGGTDWWDTKYQDLKCIRCVDLLMHYDLCKDRLDHWNSPVCLFVVSKWDRWDWGDSWARTSSV